MIVSIAIIYTQGEECDGKYVVVETGLHDTVQAQAKVFPCTFNSTFIHRWCYEDVDFYSRPLDAEKNGRPWLVYIAGISRLENMWRGVWSAWNGLTWVVVKKKK